MLSEDDVLDNQMIEEVIDKGYSRIPVYEGIDRTKVRRAEGARLHRLSIEENFSAL